MKAISNSAICPNCGGGHKSRPFCLYENGWHCFACGYTKASDRSFTVTSKKIEIPEWLGASNNYEQFSISAKLWLMERGITKDDVYKYKIYCENDLLVFVGNERPLYYQVRNITNREFKTYGEKSPTLLSGDGSYLVIVEDFVSAIRVNKCNYNVVCLWGTFVDFYNISQWFKMYDSILVWLDNDTQKETNSGQEAAKKIIEMSQKCIRICDKKRGWTQSSNKVINVLTEKDPKCYYDTEIQNILRRALNER